MKTNAWGPIIAAAIIWAAVIVAVSSALEGLAVQRHVRSLLGGGAAGTIIVLGGWFRCRA